MGQVGFGVDLERTAKRLRRLIEQRNGFVAT